MCACCWNLALPRFSSVAEVFNTWTLLNVAHFHVLGGSLARGPALASACSVTPSSWATGSRAGTPGRPHTPVTWMNENRELNTGDLNRNALRKTKVTQHATVCRASSHVKSLTSHSFMMPPDTKTSFNNTVWISQSFNHDVTQHTTRTTIVSRNISTQYISDTSCLPGQSSSSQFWNSFSGPSQNFPPYDGSGLVHCLARTCRPLPHVTEHTPHKLHADHLPLTWTREQSQRRNLSAGKTRRWQKMSGRKMDFENSSLECWQSTRNQKVDFYVGIHANKNWVTFLVLDVDKILTHYFS